MFRLLASRVTSILRGPITYSTGSMVSLSVHHLKAITSSRPPPRLVGTHYVCAHHPDHQEVLLDCSSSRDHLTSSTELRRNNGPQGQDGSESAPLEIPDFSLGAIPFVGIITALREQ